MSRYSSRLPPEDCVPSSRSSCPTRLDPSGDVPRFPEGEGSGESSRSKRSALCIDVSTVASGGQRGPPVSLQGVSHYRATFIFLAANASCSQCG
eukprot:6434854-Prymnesium_polylepis.1